MKMMKKTFVLIVMCCFGSLVYGQDVPADVKKIMGKYACLSCHHQSTKIVGPSFREIGMKHKNVVKLTEAIKNPKIENWPGYTAMPSMAHIPEEELKVLATFIASCTPKEAEKTADK